MKGIKVCHISTVHTAFDGRIFHKECVSLAEAGYSVSLVVTHEKDEVVNGVNIVALNPSKGRLYRFFIKSWLAFFKALRTKSKVYHIHDPELMIIGLMFRLLGNKVVFDSHENVSHQIETKEWLGSKFIRSIVKGVYIVLERFFILFFHRVISVTPEIVSHLANEK